MTGLLIYVGCLLCAVLGIYLFGTWYLGPAEDIE